MVVDNENDIDKIGGNRIIKNLAKFKSFKNSGDYKRLVENLI